MITISSNQNPIIKEIKSLKDKKNRDEKQLFFIEGIRFVEEAIKEKAEIVKMFVSEKLEGINGGSDILSKVIDLKIESYLLTDKLFKEISDTENPQGIIAVIKIKKLDKDNLYLGKSLIVILDSIQDPGNMGTIIRTADASGATGIIVTKGCVDIYNPKVLRATMGSIFHVPIFQMENVIDIITELKSKNIKVFCSHLKGNSNYYEQDMKCNLALIIGNEANGISDEVAGLSDIKVKIPMPGRAESLNASIAAALMMFEVVRQRMG